jgi:hypothetical protein
VPLGIPGGGLGDREAFTECDEIHAASCCAASSTDDVTRGAAAVTVEVCAWRGGRRKAGPRMSAWVS